MISRLTGLRRQWRSLLLPIIVVLYLLFLLGYGLLWAVVRDRLWQTDFLSNFTAWYFVPALVLLIAALLLKRLKWAGVLLIPLAVFVLKYGVHFLPAGLRVSTTNDSPTLTVMTMNALKRNTDWAAVQAQIQAANPDAIAIQEMSEGFLANVWPTLITSYPYNVSVFSPLDESSMGVLSRYPIVEQENFNLPDNYELTHIRAVLDVNGQQVALYNMHMTAPSFVRSQGQRRFIGRIFPYEYFTYYRRWQMDNFYPKLAAETLPVVVMGDFNTADPSGDYDRFVAGSGLQDAYAQVGFGLGFSFPSEVIIGSQKLPFIPLMRLDYIWHSANLIPTAAWLGGSTGSDHLPVIAHLQLPTG